MNKNSIEKPFKYENEVIYMPLEEDLMLALRAVTGKRGWSLVNVGNRYIEEGIDRRKMWIPDLTLYEELFVKLMFNILKLRLSVSYKPTKEGWYWQQLQSLYLESSKRVMTMIINDKSGNIEDNF